MSVPAARISISESISAEYLPDAYLDTFTKFYPDFDEWFTMKVVPNLGTTRKIFLAQIDKNVSGICIIKNSEFEKKICSLRVFESYRRQGVGTALIKHAIVALEDSHPLITVPEESLAMYKPLFNKFHFHLRGIYASYYRTGKKEYAFNGSLKPQIKSYENSGISALQLL